MEDNGLRVGVIEQVEEFFRPVAVVGVDRRKPALEGGVVGLEILWPVVEEGRHLRLAVQAGRDQVCGQGIGTGVEIAPGHHPLALDKGRAIWLGGGDRLPYVGEHPGTQRVLPQHLFFGGIWRPRGARSQSAP